MLLCLQCLLKLARLKYVVGISVILYLSLKKFIFNISQLSCNLFYQLQYQYQCLSFIMQLVLSTSTSTSISISIGFLPFNQLDADIKLDCTWSKTNNIKSSSTMNTIETPVALWQNGTLFRTYLRSSNWQVGMVGWCQKFY